MDYRLSALQSAFIIIYLSIFGIGNNIMSNDPTKGQRSNSRRPFHKSQQHSEKGTVHFPALNSPEGEGPPQERVEVYLRSASKKGIKILLPSKVALEQIKSTAEERLGIEREKQLLHLNGKDITEYSHIHLESLNIIHIAHRDRLLKPQERVKVEVMISNAFANNITKERVYIINGSEKVQELITIIQKDTLGELNSDGQASFYSLLQSSRLLDKKRSFYEQGIAENAELICLITKNQLKTRFSNDTREDILHDISVLLDLDTRNEEDAIKQKHSPVSQDLSRQVDNERQQLFEESVQKGDYKRSRRQSLTGEEQYQEEQQNQKNIENSVSFKKKGRQRVYNVEKEERQLMKKIKASKSKDKLDQMLKRQGKDNIFYLEDAVEEKKQQKVAPANQLIQQDIALHKPATSIPKVMPVEQRRKIKRQMQMLFDFGSNDTTPNNKISSIQEELPKSPPTEQPPRIQKRKQKMENLRFSMGSRPAFLSNLKMPFKNQSH